MNAAIIISQGKIMTITNYMIYQLYLILVLILIGNPPIYRTKRWQRRWFVLYDDGELTYSVDDHYDTIPQAVINLNNVFEITEADAITGRVNFIIQLPYNYFHGKINLKFVCKLHTYFVYQM